MDASAQIVDRDAVVGAELDGSRLDRAAARLFPEFSRARLQEWIRGGQLRLDGLAVRQRDTVREGARLTLAARLEREVGWHAQSLPLQVLYEDEHILVIDKPAGVVVHPGAGNSAGTLVNALLAHRASLARLPRGGIVHRLDKDTSGLLVVAASSLAHRVLVDGLQRKEIRREYLAIVRGCPTGGGTIDAPMGRHPRQRTRMAVVEHGGKAAVTHFRVEERFADHAMLAVQLETGRTHQIRVHLAHRGFPIVGDPVYGGRLRLPRRCSDALAEALRAFPRQALHARVLAFTHPATGRPCEFASPVPADMADLTSVLRQENPASLTS
jgi:23S rRNA pseudouridine1911/1915/1917 synthase